MLQNILAGGNGTIYGTATRYVSVCGEYGPTTDANSRYHVVSTPGWFSKLRVEVGVAPGGGNSYNILLQVNGADTNLLVTIDGTATVAVNKKDRVYVNAGDTIRYKEYPGGSPASTTLAKYCIVFESEHPNESLILGGMDGTNLSTTVIEWSTIMGCADWVAATPAYYGYARCPANGIIKDLHVKLGTAPGVDASYTFNLYQNAADTGLTCTISDAATTASDTDPTHAVRVAPGDLLALKATPSTDTAPAQTFNHWGMTFVSDRPGESLLLANTNNAPDNAATEYTNLNSRVNPRWGEGTETQTKRVISEPCTLYSLWIRNSSTTGVGKTFTYTIRKNEAPTDITCILEGFIAQDTTHKVYLNEGDYVCIESVPANTPSSNAVQIGIIQYIPPKYPGLKTNLGPMGTKLHHSDNGLGLQRHPRSRIY